MNDRGESHWLSLKHISLLLLNSWTYTSSIAKVSQQRYEVGKASEKRKNPEAFTEEHNRYHRIREF